MRPTGWSRSFNELIALPDGRRLVTLLDAGNYIAALPRPWPYLCSFLASDASLSSWPAKP